MKTLKTGIFHGCSSLIKIIIPSNIERISIRPDDGYGTFENSGLQEIIFEEGIKYIGYYTFRNCTKL